MKIVKLTGDNIAYANVDDFYDDDDNLIIELRKREFSDVTIELLLIDDMLIVIRIKGHELISISERGAQYFSVTPSGSLLQQQRIKKGLFICEPPKGTLSHL